MTDTAEHWQERIAALQAETAMNTQALAAAQAALATAKLEGTPTTDFVAELHDLRDETEALQSAQAEAQRRFAAASARDQEAVQAEALKLAHKAAKARHKAAEELDEAMGQAQQALTAFRAAGLDYMRHIAASGGRAPSYAKMEAGEPLRGAMLHHAPTLAAILQTPRTVADLRRPLSGWVAQQTPWKG